jgi:hypothetical protein
MNTFAKKGGEIKDWANLLKKCSKDLTNRWMFKHLYGKHVTNQSISEEDPDGSEGVLIDHDFPDYQIGPEEQILIAQYVECCADRIYRIVAQYRSPQGIFMVRMAMNKVFGNEPVFYQFLPPNKRALVNWMASEFKEGFDMATNRKKFETAISGGAI